MIRQYYFKFFKKILTLSSNKGFTLLELLVVFSLATFVTGLGIVSFVGYGRIQDVAQSTNNIKLLIQEAKFNSLSAVRPAKTPLGNTTSCSDDDPLSGYRLDFSLSNTKVSLFVLCGAQPEVAYKTVNLPTNVTIGTGTTCSSVQFDVISAKTNGPPCDIEIQGIGNQKKTISIDILGNVSIN